MSAVARSRMDTSLKTEAESILSSIGITPSEAIRILYKQIINRQGFPLELRTPNSSKLAAFKDVDNDVEELEKLTDSNKIWSNLSVASALRDMEAEESPYVETDLKEIY